MTITIIHTADWQLGAPFGRFPAEFRSLLGDQRFQTVRRIGELASQRRAEAILVAGDVFDSETPSDATIHRAIGAMAAFAGPWVLLPGNHDAARAQSVWTRIRAMPAPANLHIAATPEPILLAQGRLAILPAPLLRRHEPGDVTEWFDTAQTPGGAVRVGLAHGSVPDRLPEAADAANPIAADRAARARLDYLALGDWHGSRQIDARTWYAGTPEPDRWKENDPGNVLVISLAGPGMPPEVEKVPVGHLRWRSIEVSLHGVDDIAVVIEAQLAPLASAAELYVVALRLKGTINFAQRQQLNHILDGWSGRLRYLQRDEEGLIALPTEDDFDRIDRGGFVRTAVERLRAKANDVDDPQRDLARQALQILYVEHVGRG